MKVLTEGFSKFYENFCENLLTPLKDMVDLDTIDIMLESGD